MLEVLEVVEIAGGGGGDGGDLRWLEVAGDGWR